jgi:hypothetical protein
VFGRGELVLADSLGYTGNISGFSPRGTTLDLKDVAFVSSTEATYSGTASGGVLTVTDGAHTAHINMVGEYLGVTFVASNDGGAGTDVIAQAADVSAPVHAFVSAMAGLGAPAGQAVHVSEAISSRDVLLTSPKAAIA